MTERNVSLQIQALVFKVASAEIAENLYSRELNSK